MKTLLPFLLLAVVTGCTALESGTRAGFSVAMDAAEATLKARWPGMKAEILEGARGLADDALDKGIAFTREKTADVAEATLAKIESRTGVTTSQYDANKDGLLQLNEIAAYVGGLQEENRRREDEGEPPIPWYVYLLAIAGAPPAYGLLNSARKRSQYHRIEKKIKEAGTGPPPV